MPYKLKDPLTKKVNETIDNINNIDNLIKDYNGENGIVIKGSYIQLNDNYFNVLKDRITIKGSDFDILAKSNEGKYIGLQTLAYQDVVGLYSNNTYIVGSSYLTLSGAFIDISGREIEINGNVKLNGNTILNDLNYVKSDIDGILVIKKDNVQAITLKDLQNLLSSV